MKKIILSAIFILQFFNYSCATDRLLAGQVLQNGAVISSPNGLYNLYMQSDGSLVMYRGNGTVRYRMKKHGSYAIMQTDGNFVEYAGSTKIWESGITGSCWFPCYLRIYDNGDLAIDWSSPNHDQGGSNWGIGPDPEYVATNANRYPLETVYAPGNAPQGTPATNYSETLHVCNYLDPNCNKGHYEDPISN